MRVGSFTDFDAHGKFDKHCLRDPMLPIRPYRPADEAAAIALWQSAGLTRPWNDPKRDIERKLTVQPEMFFVIDDAGVVVATAMAGYDGHRGWVNYLAVAESHRRRGLARRLMAEAERALAERGCPKINLQIRASNRTVIAFYANLGYTQDEVVSMGRRLIPD